MKINTVTLIGLGAMGSFFAPRLGAHLGNSFRVLAGGERKARLETRGVTINGVNHRFNVITPDDQTGPADFVIIAVKDTGLKQAIADIKNQVGPNTLILSVLNGVDSEEQVAEVYGWEHVLYSYMRISIVMQDGVSDFNPDAGKVHFGEAENDVLSDRVKAVKALFDACRIPYDIDRDMIKGMWFKFMCNIGENMTCALLGVPFGAFHMSEHANEIRRKAMWEVVKIANRLGIDLGQAEIDRQEHTIKGLPFLNKPSTLQDIENKRPTEVGMFSGKVVALGEKLGIETPVNRLLYNGIRILEEKNAGLFDNTQQ
ncbi:MAG: ketopantoate reductase family protein [Clostridiales bacterium]|nr:ketopantoate reductase family protein [Clostridiales bacterium]